MPLPARETRVSLVLCLSVILAACGDLGKVTGDDLAARNERAAVLFTSEPGIAVPAEASKWLEIVRSDDGLADVRVIRVAASARAMLGSGSEVTLGLAPDRSVVVKGDRRTELAGNAVSWGGTIAGAEGRTSLVLTEMGLTGSVEALGETWVIRPIGGSLSAIARADGRLLSGEDDSVESAPVKGVPSAPGIRAMPVLPSPAPGTTPVREIPNVIYWPDTSGSYQDVLIAYTPAAAANSLNIQALAQLAIDNANDAYQVSETSFALRLAGTYQVSYDETGRTMLQHHVSAYTSNDGYMDDLPAARNAAVADIVVLIAHDPEDDYCGWGYTLAPSQYAYATMKWNCVGAPRYTFTHEVGHVQGGCHEGGCNPASPWTFARGFVSPDNSFTTIMATWDAPGVRLNRFSSRYLTYNGKPTGSATSADVQQVLINTSATIRDYRTLPMPSNITHANPGVSGVAPRLSWSAVPGATSYQIWGCLVNNGANYSPSCFTPAGSSVTTTWQNYYPQPMQTGSLSASYSCPRIAMYWVRTWSSEGLSGVFTQINICVY